MREGLRAKTIGGGSAGTSPMLAAGSGGGSPLNRKERRRMVAEGIQPVQHVGAGLGAIVGAGEA